MKLNKEIAWRRFFSWTQDITKSRQFDMKTPNTKKTKIHNHSTTSMKSRFISSCTRIVQMKQENTDSFSTSIIFFSFPFFFFFNKVHYFLCFFHFSIAFFLISYFLFTLSFPFSLFFHSECRFLFSHLNFFSFSLYSILCNFPDFSHICALFFIFLLPFFTCLSFLP